MDDQPSVDLTFDYNRECVILTIVDDDAFEVDETYNVTLTTPDDNVTLNPDSGIITITDQDG